MPSHQYLSIPLLALALLQTIVGAANGSQDQVPVSVEEDWRSQVVPESSTFDGADFYAPHDFNADIYWDPAEVHRPDDLDDGDVRYEERGSAEQRAAEEESRWVVSSAPGKSERDRDARVSVGVSASVDELPGGCASGKRVPDLESGPRDHDDDANDYEQRQTQQPAPKDVADRKQVDDLEHHYRSAVRDQLQRQQLERGHRTTRSTGINEANIPVQFKRVKFRA